MVPRRSQIDVHLARILLLLDAAGRSPKTPGVADILFMDFLVRYPVVLARAARLVSASSADAVAPTADELEAVGARSPRWKLNSDQHRYRVLLGALVGMKLVQVAGSAFAMTIKGDQIAAELRESALWTRDVRRSEIAVNTFNAADDLASVVYACLPDTFTRGTSEDSGL